MPGFSLPKVITALGIGYTCAATWVIYADIVYHNNVPFDAIQFHGLYPLSLGFSATLAALLFDKNTRDLGFARFSIKYLIIAILLPAVLLSIPFLINIATGFCHLNASPKFDMEFVAIGIPVLIILAIGEEVMWRGILYTELSKRYSFNITSAITGVCWVLWHYPVIIHTKFLYADRPLWFALASFTISVFSSSFIYNYLRHISQSIWPCIFLHAFTNYLAFVLIEPLEAQSGAVSIYFINDTGVFYTLINLVTAIWIAPENAQITVTVLNYSFLL